MYIHTDIHTYIYIERAYIIYSYSDRFFYFQCNTCNFLHDNNNSYLHLLWFKILIQLVVKF